MCHCKKIPSGKNKSTNLLRTDKSFTIAAHLSFLEKLDLEIILHSVSARSIESSINNISLRLRLSLTVCGGNYCLTDDLAFIFYYCCSAWSE